MFKRHPMEKIVYEEAGGSGSGGGGGGAPAAPQTPPVSVVDPPAASPASPSQPPAGDPPGKSWLEGLGDLGKDPSLQMFKDPSALAKSWVSAQKMIGADKIVIPGKEATEEDWGNLYNKLGRPENPDKYEWKLPEGVKMDDSVAKGFKEVAYKAGLSTKQAQALVEWDANQKIQQMKNLEAEQNNALKESLDTYKQSLGGDEKFKATVDKARIAVRSLADDSFKAFLRDSGVGSRPEAIAFFAKLADMMGEDKIRDGTGIPFKNEDPSQIQNEIESLERKMYADVNSTNMAAWVEQRNKLYERLHNLRQGA
jgi:hypothetical protein